MNACWKNLWPKAVQTDNLINSAENRKDAVVELVKAVEGESFDHMNVEDIQELLVGGRIGVLRDFWKLLLEQIKLQIQRMTVVAMKTIKFKIWLGKGLNIAEQLKIIYFPNVDVSTEKTNLVFFIIILKPKLVLKELIEHREETVGYQDTKTSDIPTLLAVFPVSL